MKSTGRAPLPRRVKSRGVAVLELALSLLFLIPLLMGMLDFGYYFYVGSQAEEAARAGVRQAVLTPPSGPCSGGGMPAIDPRAAAVQAVAVGTGAACAGGAAACYMIQPPLSMGASNITVTADCLTPTTPAPNTAPAGADPTWRVTVRVDFKLAYGFFKALFPAGTGPPGTVKYVASVTSD